MSTPTTNKLYFENLDGLRFFAFFAVFLHHSGFSELTSIQESPVYQGFQWITRNGELGVNFFFVLSGFLITYLLLQEQKLKKTIHIPWFYMRRLLRIWPLYFATIFFGFVIFPLLKTMGGAIPNETANPYLYLFFLSNFNDLYNGLPDASVLGVLWSVAIEEQFYLFWPLLLAFLPTRHYLKAFTSIIIVSFTFRYYHEGNYLISKYHTFSAISDMCVGGSIAYLSFFKSKLITYIKQLPSTIIGGSYLLGFLLLFFKQYIFTTALGGASERLILSFFFAFIILEQTYAQHSLFKVGKWKRITYWGQYTYGLYCLHFIAILAAIIISKKIGTYTSLWGVLGFEVILSLAIAMGISWLSFHLFEKHFLKLKKRFSFITKE